MRDVMTTVGRCGYAIMRMFQKRACLCYARDALSTASGWEICDTDITVMHD